MVRTASLVLIGRRDVTKPSMAPLSQLRMLGHPVVRDVVGACGVRLGSVEMEWQQYAGRRVGGICRGRLLECRTLVGESTHAAVASEIMVEGTIFLDEDHHVLNVSQFGANGWSGNGGSIATAASRQ